MKSSIRGSRCRRRGGASASPITKYNPDVAEFNERAREISEAARREVTLEETGELNQVFFTVLPGVPFTGFVHATNQPADTVPQVAFGKYSEAEGRLTVPVGVQVNHVFIDGGALGEMVERTQAWFDDPARSLR